MYIPCVLTNSCWAKLVTLTRLKPRAVTVSDKPQDQTRSGQQPLVKHNKQKYLPL